MREMSLKPAVVEALDAAEQTSSNWVMVPENIATTHQFELAVTSNAQQLLPITCITATKDDARVINAPRLPATVYIATTRPPICRNFRTPCSRLPLLNNSDQSPSKSALVVQNSPANVDGANSSQICVRKVVNSGSTNVLTDDELRSKPKKRAVEHIIFLCPLCNGICKNGEKCVRCGVQATPTKHHLVKVMSPKTAAPSRNSSPKLAGPITVVSPKAFYGAKLQSVDCTLPLSLKTPEGLVQKRIIKRIPRKRQSNEPPECLTISSDDEGLDSKDKQEAQMMANKSTSTESDSSFKSSPKIEKGKNSALPSTCAKDPVKTQIISNPPMSANFKITEVVTMCRSIRLGSFKVSSSKPFRITADCIVMTVNTVANQKEVVVLRIGLGDVAQALTHFGRTIPMIILYTNPECASAIRSRLKMISKDGPYYDPGSEDETQKRIIILPEDINDNDRSMMKVIFYEYDKRRVPVPPDGTLREIDQKAANELLVRSTPPEIVDHVNKMTSVSALTAKRGRPANEEKASNLRRKPVIIPLTRRPTEDEIQKVATYPPPPQTGGITITTEDMCCLEPGEFLNDVIIDFYLKYVVLEKLSETDRKRTHVFSSFFYGRLTRAGPTQYSLRSQGEVEDRSLLPAERRHNRVKTWTRHVDIFEKDFIIVPINENSHWYLAIICYPYLAGKISSCSPEHQHSASESETVSQTMQSSSEISTKLVDYANDTDDSSSDFGASSSAADSALLASKSTPASVENSDSPPSSNEAFARPCILLFDSLHARNWNRVVGNLREYLKMEWKAKKKTERIFDSQTIKGAYPMVPQQTNYSDCGIYLLQYVDSFFETPIENYSFPIPDLRNWFSEETINNKREEIKNIILKLQKEQQGGEDTSTECIEKGPNMSSTSSTLKPEDTSESYFSNFIDPLS